MQTHDSQIDNTCTADSNREVSSRRERVPFQNGGSTGKPDRAVGCNTNSEQRVVGEPQQVSAKNAKRGREMSHLVSKLARAQERLVTISPDEEIPFHPSADKYPILQSDLESMLDSLRDDGQSDPITLVERNGQVEIIDGRTRYKGGKKLGIPLKALILRPDDTFNAAEWIAAKFRASGKARRLTSSQLGVLAAELVPDFAEEATKRMTAGKAASPDEAGRSHEKAAAKVGAKPSAARQGLKVIKFSYLKDAVMRDEVPISTAAKIADLPDEQKRKEGLAAARKKDRVTLNRLLEITSKSTDARGKQIPSKLLTTFRLAGRVRNLAKQIRAAAETIHQIEQNDATNAVCSVNITTLREQAAQILNSIPEFVCDACDADGDECPWCEKRGWLSTKRDAERKDKSRRPAV